MVECNKVAKWWIFMDVCMNGYLKDVMIFYRLLLYAIMDNCLIIVLLNEEINNEIKGSF